MTTDYRFIPVAAPTGRITVQPAHARALAWGLASGQHPWGRDPLALPQPAAGDLLTAAKAVVERMYEDDVEFWMPNVKQPSAGVYRWTPWQVRTRRDRFILIDTNTGSITWDSGTGQPSTWIGGCLVAAAQGGLPPRVVTMRKVAALEATC